MYPSASSRLAAGSLVVLLAASAHALSGSGDSAPGNLDTVPPTPGVATVPPTGTLAGENIPYSGASDTSGIARVELWAREDSAAWAFSSLVETTAAGSFNYVPAGTGLYHFELVAEDTVGNRSAAPSGPTGTGQGSTLFSTAVADWTVLDQ